ncbi:MAG: bifunctional acetate--CoA ligase family protein/GNAT family N-acetyltransferase [Gammaproteobacteria bacterium]|nr:bifunctional acetate--CoA ligase family protein/GNAT family N-acetyltransferase [Gammaproteobacteria bacterium]
MSIRNLDAVFRPKSIAVLGASEREGSVGRILAENMLAEGFKERGKLWFLNKGHDEILGEKSYRKVSALPDAPDLAIVAIPPKAVLKEIEHLGERGTRAAVIITAGFAELGDEGRELQHRILDTASKYDMRIVGPNCLGLLIPGQSINGSFAHIPAKQGKLAFISQSGAILTSMLDWADARGVGFSSMLSLGNMSDVDIGDLLDYYAIDSDTSAVLLYMEGLKDARKFLSAARGCARTKPVIIVKSGRHAAGKKAASSHTAALAGADDVYDAAFRRAGVLRVNTLEELFDAAETLATTRPPRGRHAAVVTNGGGVGVLAADSLLSEGAKLAELEDATIEKLDAILPDSWSGANPIDIIGDAPPERFAKALEVVMSDRNIHVVLLLNCPTAINSSKESARAVLDAFRKLKKPGRQLPLLFTAWIGGREAVEGRNLLTSEGIPSFPTPEQAIRSFMYLFRYKRNQETLLETPASLPAEFEPDTARARKLVHDALEKGEEWLDEVDSKTVLSAYELPVLRAWRVKTPEDAAKKARDIGRPVALKLLSPDIVHKSEAGAVLLDIDPENVEAVTERLLSRIERENPDARIDGISVQAMADRKDAYELFVGMNEDELFGPVILFGEGGEAVEVVKDRSIGLPPLNMHLAMQVIKRTRINRRLKGFRSREPVDREALAFSLVKISQLITDIPEIIELDANPIIAGPKGVEVLDARIRLRKSKISGSERLAIRPYPQELEETVTLKDGREMLLRPIRPEDEPVLQRVFDRMTAEERRLRFMGPMKVLSHAQAARYTQLDYDRDMALVIVDERSHDDYDIHAVVRLSADSDNRKAEYAILVLQDIAGQGLGSFLMKKIIAYAREQGIGEIYGEVLEDNSAMLAICRKLGFTIKRHFDEPGVMHVSLDLDKDSTR